MKHTVELDTVNICDRLHHLSYELRGLGLACKGMEDAQGSGWVGNMIFDLADKVHDTGDEVHPSQIDPDEAMKAIGRERRERSIEVELKKYRAELENIGTDDA